LTDVVAKHHSSIESKIDVTNVEDGTQGSIILWNAENAYKALLAAGEFVDKQRILARRLDTNRTFDVVSSICNSFEASNKSIENATAILVTCGKLTTGGTPTEFYSELVGAVDTVSGDIPGSIVKLSLGSPGAKADNRGLIGSIYFFADQMAMENYLHGDAWAREQSETPWQNVNVQKFVVTDKTPPSPAA